MVHPQIIQGGMGVAVSGWRLARAVASLGQLGVVSGTLLPVVLARRLQQGDPDGDLRRALAAFPFPAVSARILARYFKPGGLSAGEAYATVPMPGAQSSNAFHELTIASNFVEVFLAKEKHSGLVGLNLLHKIQFATLPSLYGAMLAGVDYVLMGAGIPRDIPGVLDQFAAGLDAELPFDLAVSTAAPAASAAGASPPRLHFSPRSFCEGEPPALRRPQFLAIVSSAVLATTLARKSNGAVNGFVVEGELAGGHNAPPRGPLQLTPAGEPVYGPRDVPELDKIRALGLPFWLAGASATPEKLAAALACGAQGVQVGTAFAFCEESGIEPALKRQALQGRFDAGLLAEREGRADLDALVREGKARVFTDPQASPTGFPFKVLGLADTLSEPDVYAARERVCDLGYLRQAFTKADGSLGYRCAGEPVDDYVRKGGDACDTPGRKCLCNGLLATVGLGQRLAGGEEPALITAGNDVAALDRYLSADRDTYSAADVINSLLASASDRGIKV
jgi:nitronate monooxygenase